MRRDRGGTRLVGYVAASLEHRVGGTVLGATCTTTIGAMERRLTLRDGSAVVVPSNLTWRSVDVESSQAISMTATIGQVADAGSAPFFQLSTEPGKTDRYEPTLWTSDDGVTPSSRNGFPTAGANLSYVTSNRAK